MCTQEPHYCEPQRKKNSWLLSVPTRRRRRRRRRRRTTTTTTITTTTKPFLEPLFLAVKKHCSFLHKHVPTRNTSWFDKTPSWDQFGAKRKDSINELKGVLVKVFDTCPLILVAATSAKKRLTILLYLQMKQFHAFSMKILPSGGVLHLLLKKAVI